MENIIQKFASSLTQLLIQNKYIQPKDSEVVRYSIDYLCQSLFYQVSLLLLGFLTRHLLYSVVYSLTMGFLKHFTGGAHAPNKRICSLLSYGVFLATMYLTDRMTLIDGVLVSLLISTNLIVTMILAPVDCKNKKFNEKQRKKLKVISSIICIVISILIRYCFLCENYYIAGIMIFCFSINSVNLAVGFIINKKEFSNVSTHSDL